MRPIRFRRGRVLVTCTTAALVVVAGALGGIGATPAQAAPQPDVRACDLKPSPSTPDRSEVRSCLQVTARLSNAVAVKQRATLDITVKAAVARENVAITADLPPNLRWVTAPAGTTTATRVSKEPQARGQHQLARTTRSMTAGQSLHFQGIVEAIAEGTAEITVTASKDPSVEYETGSDVVFLTIGESAGRSRIGIETKNVISAVPYTGPKPAVAAAPSRGKPTGAGPARPATQAAATIAVDQQTLAPLSAGGTACAKGTWNYVDAAGNGQPGAFWTVEIWDDDGGAGNDRLATGLTGWNGEYNLCFANGDEDGSGQDIYVVFLAISNAWLVQSPNGTVYGAQTGVIWNVADGSTRDFGGLQQGDPAYFRVGAAFEAVKDVWFATPGNCWDVHDRCEYVRVRWEPSSTDGTYYNTGDNLIHLKAADPDNSYAVAHETAHSIMDDVYEHNFPATSCPSPHYRSVASEVGCAWVEGFAEWLGDVVIGTTRLESTAGWDTGDVTEGRVAGALYDLWDSANDGTDQVSEGMDGIWRTLQDHNSTTFSSFWSNRRADGLNVGNDALGALYQNSINYGYQP